MFPDWMGDLYNVEGLTDHTVGLISLVVSGLCGAIVGLERERRDKPAGLRTLILISVGATLFTMASLLIGGVGWADRSRIAAQVVTGIGFLGAGAIIHERRAVVGLTTAATIWTVAAIGVIVGSGYAFAGIVLALLIYVVLTGIKRAEVWLDGPCRHVRMRVEYRSHRGKTRAVILGLLDESQIPSSDYRFLGEAGEAIDGETTEALEIAYCTRHRAHRTIVPRLAERPEVIAVEDVEPVAVTK